MANDDPHVCYQVSRRTAFERIAVACLISLLSVVGVPAFALAFTTQVYQLITGTSAVVGCILYVLLGIALAFLYWRANCMTRLTITERSLEFSGPLVRRRVPVHRVRLIEMNPSPRQDMRCAHLVVASGMLGRPAIELDLQEAVECFDFLRERCPHAPAIGPDEEVYRALEPGDQKTDVRQLRSSLRRRTTVILMAGGAGLMLFALILFGQIVLSGQLPPNAWQFPSTTLSIGLSLVIVGCVRLFRSGALDMGPIAGGGEQKSQEDNDSGSV